MIIRDAVIYICVFFLPLTFVGMILARNEPLGADVVEAPGRDHPLRSS